MKRILKHLYLDFRLLWNHVIFWSFPTLPESHYSSIGTVYFEKGNYRKAIKLFLKSEKSHRQRDIAFSRYNTYYLGFSYLYLGHLKSAISFFVQYCRHNKNDHQVSMIIGWCYGLIGEHGKSLEWYQRSLALKPEVKGVHIACSQALAELGRNEEAIKYLESAMVTAQGPFEEKILQSLICIVRKDLVGAIEGLKWFNRNGHHDKLNDQKREVSNEPKTTKKIFTRVQRGCSKAGNRTRVSVK